MKELKRMVIFSILLLLVGLGASLTLKATIGVGAYDALTQSISFLSGIKVGTVGMMLNCSCVLGQLVLLRKAFTFRHLLQVPVSILIGVVINFIFYDVLGTITITSYLMKITLFMVAITILAFALAAVMVLDVITFALEGFCMALAKKTKWTFVVVRQSADVLSILLVLVLTFGFALPLTVREGTIIGMLFFAPIMGYFMKILRPIFRKFDFLNEEIGTDQDSVKIV